LKQPVAFFNVMALHSAAEHAHDWKRRVTTISLAQKGHEGYMEEVAAFPHDWIEKVLKGEIL
jgi:hypothetical protein